MRIMGRPPRLRFWTLPTEIVPEVEEEVAATTAPLPAPNNPGYRMSKTVRSVIANPLKAMSA